MKTLILSISLLVLAEACGSSNAGNACGTNGSCIATCAAPNTNNTAVTSCGSGLVCCIPGTVDAG
jgi:hypothetical protein